MVVGRKSGRFQKKLVRHPMIAAADGWQKGTHYAKCGVQHTAVWNRMNVAPQQARYISPSLDKAYEKYSAFNKLAANAKAAATAAARASSATGVGPGEHVINCQADLVAARDTAPISKSAHTDIKVTIAVVCPHAVSVV